MAATAQPIDDFDIAGGGIDGCLGALRAGGTVVVLDDSGEIGFGMAVIAAQHADPTTLLELSRRATGWSYLALTDERCEALGLELVAARDDGLAAAPLTATIRAREGIVSGVSVAERARTIGVAIDPGKGREDIRFGGNVLPLRARAGGVLERAGHTEASLDLVRMAGLTPAAVLAEIVNPDGSDATAEDLLAFSEREGLATVTIAEIIARRRRSERLVERIVETSLATRDGVYTAVGYLGALDGQEHMALVRGDINGREDVLVYIHTACWEGDVFRSRQCDCRARLDVATAKIAAAGSGVLVHLATPDYARHLQRAPERQMRDFGVGAQILADLGLGTIRVLTDHSRPLVGLQGFGLTITDHEPLLASEPRLRETTA